MKIKFCGATQTVTGSCFLVEHKGYKVLIDCGMFQGFDIEYRNWKKFEFDPRQINAVLLTHAHLDHCGLIPKLFREGFTGKVYMTLPTMPLATNILYDSAKVQEIRYKQARKFHKSESIIKKNADYYPFIENISPLYDSKDVENTLKNSITVNFLEKIEISSYFDVIFYRAAHTLGASSIKLILKDQDKEKSIVFSGDLGNSKNQNLDILYDYPEESDYVVMESLYGEKDHEDFSIGENKLIDIINSTISRGGNVVIPSFALQRSQELLYLIKKFYENDKISKDITTYFDSPLGIRVTEIYEKFFTFLNPEIIKNYKYGNELFEHRNIRFVKDAGYSYKIRKKRGGIIIASNGMCMGGRVIFHLVDNLPDARCTIAFVGFQAPETLGREIVDGAKTVVLENKKLRVKAEIHYLTNFSGHADKTQLLKWLGNFDKEKLKKVFLVHAEQKTSLNFKKTIDNLGYNAVVPEWKKEYELE